MDVGGAPTAHALGMLARKVLSSSLRAGEEGRNLMPLTLGSNYAMSAPWKCSPNKAPLLGDKEFTGKASSAIGVPRELDSRNSEDKGAKEGAFGVTQPSNKNRKTRKTKSTPRRKVGPNSTVEFYDGCARKIINKARKGQRERVARFKKEVEILKAVAKTDIDRVVPIHKDNLSKKPYWYEMPRLDGDLEGIVKDYRGDAMGAVRALLPIVRALQRLSEHDPAIVHRDLKPQNILYKDGETERELWLTDFGCGHLDEPEAIRPTWDFRAVGATHYRAPEYAHGKVENVSTSGDVFSIGKLLWHMVNGVRFEVFPYTLWYPPAYDLSLRFADPDVVRLNLVISHCVAIDPLERPSYERLIEDLESLGKEHDSKEMSLKDELARREAKNAAEFEEVRAHTRTLLQTVVNDLKKAVGALQVELGELDDLKPLLDAAIPNQTMEAMLDTVVDRGLDAVIWSGGSRTRSLSARAILYSQHSARAGLLPGIMRFPFVQVSVDVDPQMIGRPTTQDVLIWVDSGATRQLMNVGGERIPGAYDGSAALELLRAGLRLLVASE